MSVNSKMTAIADKIRTLLGLTGTMGLDEMAAHLGTEQSNVTAALAAIADKGVTVPDGSNSDSLASLIAGIEAGGGGGPAVPVSMKDVNFYDYDGTLVASYTLAEAQVLTALPEGPTHDGLIFQGWNWTLEKINALTRPMNVGAMYITDDGKTRIYIRLEEGRTSPRLGVCPNGTVTVDWGDGTTPDTLTGTSVSTVKWTPNHAYAAPGEYVIKLTVDGTMGFYGTSTSNQYSAILRYSSSSDNRNYVYQNSVQKIEIGNGVTSIGQYAFYNCYSLSSITIPNSVTSIGQSAFTFCYSLSSITIPNSVTSIESTVFNYCTSLSSITIHDGVTSIIGYAFYNCYSLSSITIPNSVTSIRGYAFYNCYSLSSITIPDGVISIRDDVFYNCYSLSSITIPNSVTSIGQSAFENCYSVAFYDFSNYTSVPTLSNTNAFTKIPADCQIRVPESLVDAWKAATNWSTYADHIVGV